MHGTNVVVKLPPYYPQTDGPFDPLWSLNDEDIELLSQLGFTSVRLGVMWPGYET